MHAECIDIAALKRAIETRDARTMAAFYADDALLRIIDCDNPPSKPRELAGKRAIVAYYDDVCSRAMTHSMESGVADGERAGLEAAVRAHDRAHVHGRVGGDGPGGVGTRAGRGAGTAARERCRESHSGERCADDPSAHEAIVSATEGAHTRIARWIAGRRPGRGPVGDRGEGRQCGASTGFLPISRASAQDCGKKCAIRVALWGKVG